MNTHKKCLVCQSTKLTPLEGYSNAYLQKCQECDFVFCAPIPTQVELIEHYNGYPRSDGMSAITIQRYHELLDGFEKYRKHNRIIDVGCGNGHFLRVALERGWEVYGTEFTHEAVIICEKKNIKMHEGGLDPANYPPGFFDVVTSFEVLEHLNNPLEELQRFNQILRAGGLVYATTPNFNSLTRYYLKQDWTVIQYPEHLSYYTAPTLHKLFEKSGFKTAKMKATGISVGRINEAKKEHQAKPVLVNPEANPEESAVVNTFRSDDEKLRQKIENNPLLKLATKSVNGLLSSFKVGDTLKGYFIKR